jgi:hypothetical protein
MRNTSSSLRRPLVILSFLLSATFATAAHAGFWSVVYDLAPDSTVTTDNPGGTFVDPITGSLTMFYDAASTGAPLTGAHLVAGQIDNTLSQPAGVLTVTGTGMNALSPGIPGAAGTLSGAVLDLAAVANHTVSGFLHCYDATGPGGVCNTFFGTPASNTIPQTGSGTFGLPNFNFASTAGVGDFTSDAAVSMPLAGVTVTTVYVGKEVSRTFYAPEPTAVAMLVPGVILLAGLGAARRSAKGRP